MQEQNVNEKEPMNDIKFADGSVPVAVAARVYGKEPHKKQFLLWNYEKLYF